MKRTSNKLTLCLAAALVLAAGHLSAAANVLDEAIAKYYAGYPNEAIGMLEPLAGAGDADAQYLLGNILYTLAKAGQPGVSGDPARWYKMAAEQGSAPANYALGAIHNNRWLQSHRDADANLAQAYFQRALELGDENARVALEKLAAYRKQRDRAVSLTYSNESFGSKREPAARTQPAPRAAPQAASRAAPPASALADALAGFQSSGDPAADAEKIKQLLIRLDGGEALAADGAPSIGTLAEMLGRFESAEQLLSRLAQLFGYIEEASDIKTAPGSN